MENLKSIRIPFSGFYETSHDNITCDSIIESEQYNLHDELGASWEQVQEWAEQFISGVNWQAVHIAYCKEYVNRFEEWLKEESPLTKPKLVFDEMTSPREYNFETDKIYAKIAFEDLEEMFDCVKAKELPELIKEKCTSRSGFISFYSNDHNEWYAKPFAEWDEVELSMVFEASVIHVLDGKNINEEFEAYTFMENASCNGVIDNIVWGNMTDKFKAYDSTLRKSLEKVA